MKMQNPRRQMKALSQRLRQWAYRLKYDVLVIYFALKHPQTPFYAKLVAALIVCYALSPIDVIPDFIPVLGYLDEVILLPLGIAFAIKLLPPNVLADCREEGKNNPPAVKPKLWFMAYVTVILWVIVLYALYEWIR